MCESITRYYHTVMDMFLARVSFAFFFFFFNFSVVIRFNCAQLNSISTVKSSICSDRVKVNERISGDNSTFLS